MSILTTILYIALCVALFSLAIAIHEFGHFMAALLLGLRVERFSIGFGPAIVKKTWRGVEYRISWIPLGGYVSIPDVDPEGTDKLQGGDGKSRRERIPAWKELVVAFAGPAMNIVLAALIAVLLSLVPGIRFGELEPVIGSFLELADGAKCPAEAGGMKAGDRVLSVGGREISTWNEVIVEVQISDARPTEFKVRRGEEELSLTITPRRDEASGACFIGALSMTSKDGVNHWLPARNPLLQLQNDAGAIFRVLHGLVTPREMKATGKALGGPVMIAEGIYGSIRSNFWDGIGFLRFLNVNLAVLNLLPIPVLDGGLIMFALIALLFRRRVPDKIVGALSTAFMYALIALMVFLIYRDSARSWRMHTRKQPELKQAAETEGAVVPPEAADGAEAKD